VVFGARKNKKIKIKDDLNLNWYGHRGLLNRAPENTWLGFQAALDAGFRSIEIDVLQTKDGKIVCTHNFDLEYVPKEFAMNKISVLGEIARGAKDV